MSGLIDQGLQVQLRDEAGNVQVFLPGEVVAQLTAERDCLRQELSLLREQLEAVVKAKKQVEAERDQYLHGLRTVMEQDLGPSEQSWIAVMKNGVLANEVLRELEEILDMPRPDHLLGQDS